MSTTKETPGHAVEVRKRLTEEQAHEQGLVPHGSMWDEEAQQAVPFGFGYRERAIARGENLEQRLTTLERDRNVLTRFIEKQMVEAQYNAADGPGGKKGYPVKGSMHDFYKLPNYDKKALTKQGSEKLAQFFNLRRAATETVERECTKEFTRAVVRVRLVDKWGQPAGSGEAAANTAESSFKNASAKYGGDFRAAENDVISRAGKRAFVQAVVYATATDEIFDASGEVERTAEAKGVTEETTARQPLRFPTEIKQQAFAHLAGTLISKASHNDLAAVADYCRGRRAASAQALLAAVEDEIEVRRIAAGEREEDEEAL